ncbi:hypothetical protein L1887_07542 [Cichorium endivia]|nr:hypothetical protein L1887_07542 [Cichorium endivia]
MKNCDDSSEKVCCGGEESPASAVAEADSLASVVAEAESIVAEIDCGQYRRRRLKGGIETGHTFGLWSKS